MTSALAGLDSWITNAPEASDDGDCENEALKACPACKGECEIEIKPEIGRAVMVDCPNPECKDGFTEQTCGGNINQVGDGFACDSCDWTEGPDDQ